MLTGGLCCKLPKWSSRTTSSGSCRLETPLENMCRWRRIYFREKKICIISVRLPLTAIALIQGSSFMHCALLNERHEFAWLVLCAHITTTIDCGIFKTWNMWSAETWRTMCLYFTSCRADRPAGDVEFCRFICVHALRTLFGGNAGCLDWKWSQRMAELCSKKLQDLTRDRH